ncbi:hypothetical protein ACFY1B_05745 [Streptomyces mirabilis]|uniref:hypothetical protein n=1 Tax=Streptomyces mirabilis TaxID=68239 RepID=UPI003698FCE5
MKTAMVGVVAAGVFLAGAGVAIAESWHYMPNLQAPGVVFERGQYRFNPPGQNHGSFEWAGYLKDGAPRDGHNIYVRVRVEGRDGVEYYGKQGQLVFLHKSIWEASQRYTDDAYVRACVDRGAVWLDACSTEVHFRKG